MNEEELKKDLNKELCFDENMVGYKVMNNYIDKAIKIGKLEQKKEELFYFQRAYLLIPMYKSKGKFYSIKSCDKLSKWIEKRIKLLQKEIK